MDRAARLLPPPPLRTLARLVLLGAVPVALLYSLVLPPPVDAFGGDKVMHAAGYGGLVVLGALGWPDRIGQVALCVLLAGIGVELMQFALPRRALEYGDLLANSAGIGAATVLARAAALACARAS